MAFPSAMHQGLYFNPLAPHGARRRHAVQLRAAKVFQSTRPARGETNINMRVDMAKVFQSTRPARGETCRQCGAGGGNHFNPLAPHGARRYVLDMSRREIIFQSTRPARGETRPGLSKRSTRSYFNPLAPHGARPGAWALYVFNTEFQSTRPARGETVRFDFPKRNGLISIHSPRTGRDRRPSGR